ncbi:hypothetical protein AVEN_102104-1 [Araneus ventricosus]|uniref:Uncharacterized protein n=1 Tax=Araneus ventricosus TaxID=182803 RepID=A0A4Y2V429_ARAVE|nr:hypothetical protein AVEN_102104-1 [Araneus ventricosus]
MAAGRMKRDAVHNLSLVLLSQNQGGSSVRTQAVPDGEKNISSMRRAKCDVLIVKSRDAVFKAPTDIHPPRGSTSDRPMICSATPSGEGGIRFFSRQVRAQNFVRRLFTKSVPCRV